MNALKEKTFRFLTWNIKMLPGLAGEGSKDEKRAKKIARKILEQDYDVICLQELFDEDARAIIAQKLKAAYPCQIRKTDDGDIIRQDSGLFVASRLPFYKGKKNRSFKRFNASRGADRFAAKGILATRFDLKKIRAGLSLIVFNSHFQSDYEWVGENAATRRKQLRQSRKFIRKILRRVPENERRDSAALFVGDLNIDGASPEWSGIVKILEYPRDIYNELHDSQLRPGYTWDGQENKNMIPKTDKDRLRLDYIFALDNIPVADQDGDWQMAGLTATSCGIQHFATTNTARLSDHFAVEAALTISDPPGETKRNSTSASNHI